jgi:RNA polymerase sigma-70 factor (ECF subfamily)
MYVWPAEIVRSLPPAARGALSSAGDRLVTELATARARFPEATVGDNALAEALARQLAGQPDPAAALARLRVDDFLLAQWCATGDPRAIATFERVHRADIDAVIARFRRLALGIDELRQLVRIKLFVSNNGRPPRIADYSGFGFLQNWLRVTALRALVDLARSERARKLEELLEDDDLLDTPAESLDIVPPAVRARYGAALKKAFACAVAQLAPRQRNLLRYVHVEHLTLDQIAALYKIHRATVARNLAQARADLVATTRRELGESVGVGDAAVDSIVRAADRRIDLSLSRLLRPPADDLAAAS